jgi:hypothetical protein
VKLTRGNEAAFFLLGHADLLAFVLVAAWLSVT